MLVYETAVYSTIPLFLGFYSICYWTVSTRRKGYHRYSNARHLLRGGFDAHGLLLFDDTSGVGAALLVVPQTATDQLDHRSACCSEPDHNFGFASFEYVSAALRFPQLRALPKGKSIDHNANAGVYSGATPLCVESDH